MKLHSSDRPSEPIAIIGTGLRFPGGTDTPTKLWDLLREPRDVQSVIPTNRFEAEGFYSSDNHQGMSHTRHGYFLSEDHRHFDAEFFGIKPIEANAMDPQHRMLLEVVYESIESAGLSMNALRGSSTAVYVGLMAGDYNDMLNRDTSDFPPYIAAGTSRSMISNRVSYFFDWRGPSITIDTACSSSLVAVHQAVQSLRLGESQMAVAAGANLLLGPEQFVAGSNMKMLSPDGRSYMWDSRANGYARGEGIAAIVLKTLSTAIADGDDIECLIVETGVNQDGRTKGLTVPSPAAQTTLIESTYRKAGLDLTKPSDRPQYFEAHGTGTPAGDPVEAQAIHDAFFRSKSNDCVHASDPLYCGSIKTIIGHTEGTAGLAGLIKASLALKHGIIPPNRLFENLAPAVEPFYNNLEIVTKAKSWPALEPGSVRRASVNSFGFGGTNAHCILEGYCPVKRENITHSTPHMPFTFSAASEKSLLSMIAAYSRYLKLKPSTDLCALSHTLCTRRTEHPIRASIWAKDVEELCSKLDLFVQGSGATPTLAASVSALPLRILGIFTGQGAQWAGMARRLMQFPAAVKIIDELECSLAELQDPPSWSLKAEVSADKSSSRIKEAAIAQPVCTAVQILLVEMLRAAGIGFTTVVGHSSGEIAAAFAADRLSAKDAIRIAYYRGVHLPLVGGTNGEAGAMIAVGASYEEAQAICDLDRFRGRICVAACNSAASVTMSGDAMAIQDVKGMFHAQNRFARHLKVDNAYHSHHMIRCSEAITASLRACSISFQRPSSSAFQWVSSVDMKPVTDDLDILDYWHRNTVGCVFFSQALEYALGLSDFDAAVEVGAHPALKGPALQVIESVLGHDIPYTGMLSRNRDDVEAFSDGLGYMWANIRDPIVDFAGYDRFVSASGPPQVLKDIPLYPWDHDRAFWYESRNSHTFRHRSAHHELLGTKTSDCSADQIIWKGYIVPRELPWVSGHRIQGQMVFPGSGYIVSAFEAAREAAREVAAEQSVRLIELKNLTFGQPLVFDSEDTRVEVLITLSSMRRHKSSMTANFSYHSVANKDLSPMSLNANGQLCILFDPNVGALQSFPEGLFGMTEVNHERIYTSFANCGYHYSGPFKALDSVKRKLGVASGMIQAPSISVATRSLIHPATLDAAIHSIAVAHSYPGDGRLTSILLPVDVAKISIDLSQAARSAGDRLLRFTSFSRDDGEGDVDLYPADGSNAILRLEGIRTKPMSPASSANDIHLFSETVWGPAFPMVEDALENSKAIQSCSERDLHVISAIARQISHRYPAMRILNIGARAVNATKHFLTELDGAFASYTYTDISRENLDQAEIILKSFHDKLIYKIMDLNIDFVNQGFAEHSFDLIVALSNFSDIPDLEYTMKTIRRLLKPGGYFLCPHVVNIEQLIPDLSSKVVAEVQSNSGVERLSGLSTDVLTRAQTLEKHDFADADWLLGSTCTDLSDRPITLLQAIDERIRLLREPLALVEPHKQFPGITVIGGSTSATSTCINSLMSILQGYNASVTQVKTLSDLVDSDLSFGGNVLLLQDHDKPLFEDFHEMVLKGLQRLFRRSRDVLWITHGYKRNLPHARMLVAFARCLLQEMPHIRLQILDLPSTELLDATVVSRNLIRLLVTGKWEDEGRLEDILWSAEPEISYENGHQWIPRVKLSKSRNSRYNSSRRMITIPVDPCVSPVTVSVEDDTYILKAKDEPGLGKKLEHFEIVNIRITYSLLKAVRVDRCGYFYLLMGIDTVTHEQVVALSSTLASVVDVPKSLVRPCVLPQSEAVRYLHALFCGMISYTALQGLASGQCILMLEPQRELAVILEAFATARDVNIVFFTGATPDYRMTDRCPSKQLPFRASKREIMSALPRNSLTRIVCWEESDWMSNVREGLPNDIPIYAPGDYVAKEASIICSGGTFGAAAVLDRVQCQLDLAIAPLMNGNVDPLPLASLYGLNVDVHMMKMIDWSDTSSVPRRVEPLNHCALFRSDRTYWLVGLTGDLGLSLCEWMIARNATHIVLSSRNPSIDPQWLVHFQSLGATVKVHNCDVTDYRSVQKVHHKIRKDLPPIAGVCHGAMVLRDALIQDLDIRRVEQVLKPKVDGAIHLDKIFQHYDLDFFVMLSSVAAVTGNPGQAAYAAANGFLAALTAQRRARGMSASCIALGAILGSGYATRGLSLAQQRSLEKAGVMWTSEQDFHTAFAEAVVASPPGSDTTGEFGTGVPICYTDEEYKPKHANSPIFAHLLLQRVSDQQTHSNNPAMTTKAQLLQATTIHDVSQILEAFLAPRLRKALQMASDANVIDQTAETLGIDSLIAVEMRSWLMRELNIDMPILVIIGGNTMRGVLVQCLKSLHPTMTPLLKLGPHTDTGKSSDTNSSTGTQKVRHGPTAEIAPPHSAPGASAASAACNGDSPHNSEYESQAEMPAAIQLIREGTNEDEMRTYYTAPTTSTPKALAIDMETLPVGLRSNDPGLERSYTSKLGVVTTINRCESTHGNSVQLQGLQKREVYLQSLPNITKQSRVSRFRKAILKRILPA